MKRAVWLTDIHLNFLPPDRVERFLLEVAAAQPDAVLVSGDIAEAHDVCDYLLQMRRMVAAPIYFVLGNHDFYHGSVRVTRERVTELCRRQESLHYLTVEEADSLAPGVGVVGHDGWADGRLGDYERSRVRMLDWKLVEELAGRDRLARWEAHKGLADQAAAHTRRVLPGALARYQEVFLVTHVPPFLGACWHEGQISDEQWSPHFTSHVMGQTILEIMNAHPEHKLTVLCGHTHGAGEFRPSPNVEVLTGGAEYGLPRIVRVFEYQ